jgi:hypothetical protein
MIHFIFHRNPSDASPPRQASSWLLKGESVQSWQRHKEFPGSAIQNQSPSEKAAWNSWMVIVRCIGLKEGRG